MTIEHRRGVQSIDTGIRLLEALERADGPLALKDLSARADMEPSNAHRYLASFMRAGLVQQGADSRYDFGPFALRLGLSAMRRADPVKAAERALPALVAETGRAALLCVWSNRGPTVVHLHRSNNTVFTNLGLGSVLPAARSSLGRILLAFLPESVTAETLALEAERDKIDRAWLEREIARARKTRLTYADKAVNPGLYATASVVLGWNGEAVCAVALIGPDAGLARVDNPSALVLRETCARLSREAGARDFENAA
jgi:DNA-binding IclR family transcriptional regulator